MAGFRIRRGQQEFPVPDIDALIRLAREGRLQPADPVGTPEGWKEARQIPELRPFLSDDPWSAWEEAEDLDAKDVYREALQSSPEAMDLPVHALSPLMVIGGPPKPPAAEEPPAEEPEPLSLEPLSLEPLPPDDDSSEFDEPLDNTTSVFALPARPPASGPSVPPAVAPAEPSRPPLTVHSGRTPRPGTTTKPGTAPPRPATPHRNTRPPRTEHLPDGSELIHLPRPLAPDLPRTRPPQQSFRVVRVLTWLFVGVLLMLLGYATVRLSAPKPPVAKVAPPAPSSENPLQAVDRELRSAIPRDPRPIKAAGDFTDILTIELQQIGVDVSLVDALITQWGGRPSEQQPQAAEIRITIRTQGAIERELGAIGMIVGRYVHLYRLKVPVFEVVVHSADGSYKRSFEAQRADQLYAGTLSLENYLR